MDKSCIFAHRFIRLSGGTGRRARLKIVYRKVCRFDSGLRYKSKATSRFGWLFIKFFLIP